MRIPLSHHHTRFAGKRAIAAWLALLIGAHGPAGILGLRRDGNKVRIIGGKGAISALDKSVVLGTRVTVTVMAADPFAELVQSSVRSGGVGSSRQRGHRAEEKMND